jgi:hypothetical protein
VVRRLVPIVAVSLLAGGPLAEADAAEPSTGTRGCRARIESGSQPGGLRIDRRRDLRIGPVVFFGLRRPEHQMISGGRGRDPGAKIPIAVRAGKPVVLRIPPEARQDIALNYAVDRDGSGNDVRRVSDGQYRVRVTPCPPRTRRFSGPGRVGRWTAFSGGFVFRAKGCYPIEVARAGKPFKRRLVAFGAPC